MRVAVAEDVAVYRAGLIRFLEAAGIDVIYEAVNDPEMLAHLNTGNVPDVAIMDINMAGQEDDGLICADRIGAEYPNVGVLLLSAWAEATYAERPFANGSARKGYMLKDTLNSVPHLREALDRVDRSAVVGQLGRSIPVGRHEIVRHADDIAVRLRRPEQLVPEILAPERHRDVRRPTTSIPIPTP